MDPYDILGVTKTTPFNEIKTKYKQLALQYHPDKNPNTLELFKLINSAYEAIKKKQDTTNDIIGRSYKKSIIIINGIRTEKETIIYKYKDGTIRIINN